MLFGGFACTPDNGEEGDNSYAELTVTPASISATLEGATETLVVTSNATWVATCDQTDVVLSTIAGNGNGTVTVEIPSVTAARNFVIKFVASKMVSVAGVTVPSTHEFDVQVSQNATGTDLNSYAYYEDCGTDVEKDGSYWPYVDAFTGWNPQGASATGVSYKGSNASVRASGNAYQPTADAVGISGQPYVFLNKVPSSANFVIENIAVEGGKNYVFTYNAQCQNAYDGGKPGFATVDNSLVHLELGYDGVNWDAVDCTYTPNGGNGWYAVQTEFKVAADATKLYARFTYEAPASNGGGRFDDFKLVEGGNGAELEVSAPQAPETQEGTIASITTTGNFSVKNAWVIATYAQGFLMTDSSNAILLVYQGTGANIPTVGQVVDVTGTVSTYAGFLQFAKDGLTVETTGETKTVTNPTPETMSGSALDAWLKTPSIKYVEYVGQLTISGNYYNVTIPGASTAIGSVQYPTDAIKTTLDGLSGKYIKVTGWLIGYSQSKYTNTMATAVVETEAPETPDTPDTPDTPVTPDVPAGEYTLIEKVADLVAGEYYVAGKLASYTNSGTTYDWTNYPYHFWTGTISSKNDLNTVNGNVSMTLDPNMSATDAAKGAPAKISIVAVDGKTNTYYVQVGAKYLYSTETANRKMALGDTPTEWVVSDNSNGGITFTSNGVNLGTAGATYDLIRSYANVSTLKHGLVLFKEK